MYWVGSNIQNGFGTAKEFEDKYETMSVYKMRDTKVARHLGGVWLNAK